MKKEVGSHDDIAVLPLMLVHQLVRRGVVDKVVEQVAALVAGPVVEPDSEASIDVERRPACDWVITHAGVRHLQAEIADGRAERFDVDLLGGQLRARAVILVVPGVPICRAETGSETSNG